MLNKTVDLVIENIQVYNSYVKQFRLADVYIKEGKFFHIDQKREKKCSAKQGIDGTGKFMVPGLVDIHMHIESSMMVPAVFCKHVASCGVTTIVSEPHEMANVNGLQGVLDMIDAGKQAIIDVYYGIPSSVPSVSSDLETTGGVVAFDDMCTLLDTENIICVGEIMNYRKIIQDNDLEITKFLQHLQKKKSNIVVEGHCPSLMGEELSAFLFLGINGDHTEHSLEEIGERFEQGMFVEIQEKMLSKELMQYIMEHNLYEHFAFATDDVMADELFEHGQIDVLVRKAIQLGMSAEDAIYGSTFTPARRMLLNDRGAIAPGKIADFVLLDDVNEFNVNQTYKNGRCIYDCHQPVLVQQESYRFEETYYNSIRCNEFTVDELMVHADVNDGEVWVRVMEISDGSTKTVEGKQLLSVKNGIVQWENSGLCLVAVKERYHGGRTIGLGFATGDCIKHGAVASTYAHDSHNMLVIGTTVEDMLVAANRVIELQGGIVTAEQGVITAELGLPVGGIISDQPIEEISGNLKAVRMAMSAQGYQHYNPIMSLCTLTLPVSPKLKITDRGLVDVVKGEIVPLILS